MKPTAMKIIISVLMTMFFQSGHGMEKWYGDALCLAFRGEMKRSVQIVHNNAPNLIEITDPKLIPVEIEHIIDGKPNFVAIACGSDEAAYSNDGINWTKTSLPSSAEWNSVCYGNGKFVAVSADSKATYSYDGIKWYETKTTLPENYQSSVCYGNGKFVAVAEEEYLRASYSNDGIKWTETDSFPRDDFRSSVCYGNGLFAAIAPDSYSLSSVAYSYDGKTWLQTKDSPLYRDDWQSICYGKDKFVAISSYESCTSYSLDGIHWKKPAYTLLYAGNWKSVCYGKDKFVVVACNNSDKVAYSLDGITWTTKEGALPSKTDWYSVCYGKDKFVAVGNHGNAAYSVDGTNWAPITSLSSDSFWYSVCCRN